MIVTDSTLVGYTMINGTWGLQMALLIGSLSNFFINPDPLDMSVATQTQIDELRFLRLYLIPMTHGSLMLMLLISSSDRIPWDEVKQGLNFLAMILQINMILSASLGMANFDWPIPSNYPYDKALQWEASYIWLEIEQLVFLSVLASNVIFLVFRSCVRHKLRLDRIDEKRQLPNVDTIIALSEVANAFHA